MLGYIQVFLVCIFVVDSSVAIDCEQRPAPATILKCCGHTGLLVELQDKCAAQYPVQPQMQFCFGECLFNGTGLALNKELHKENMETALAQMYKSMPDFIPIAQPIMAKCIDYAITHLAKITEKHAANAGNCKPEFGVILTCYATGTLPKCPSPLATDECNQTKEFVKTCYPPKN